MPYHLVVSSVPTAFSSSQFEMPTERCLEYTESRFQEYFFRFGETRVAELLAFPALLAHESCVTDPQVRLVRLTEIMRRQNRVRGRFEPIGTQELAYHQFKSLRFELD